MSTKKKTTKKATTKKVEAKKPTIINETKKVEVKKPIIVKETKKEIVKPISTRISTESYLNKSSNTATKLFMKYYKTAGLFIIGLIIGIVIVVALQYGNIAKLSNGKDLLVSVDGLKISADTLYTEMKETYGIATILKQIDKRVLTDKYDSASKDASKYADEYLKSLKAQYSTNWSEFLAYYGMKDDAALKATLILQFYTDKNTEAYVTTKVSEKEINDYYKDEIVGDVKVSHILIKADYKDGATEEEKEVAFNKAKVTADDLIKQLKASAKPLELFATLAKSKSGDTSNASKGGDLGYFNKGEMEATFEAASYALVKVGEFTTTPVKTSYGYHIIIKTDKTKDKAALKDIKSTITSTIVKAKTAADTSLAISAMVELRKEYKLTFEEPTMKAEYDKTVAKQIADAIKADKEKETAK